jgi:hypothetical protein
MQLWMGGIAPLSSEGDRSMTPDEADRLVEGDRVRMRGLSGIVVGTTANCVSIQWDGRATPEIYTVDDMRPISKAMQQK